MKYTLLILYIFTLAGCNSKLTNYNIKTNVGRTVEDGRKSVYTGVSLDSHFEVR